ncbi:nitroreductase/quinone reductase family protein [Mycobacterium malmoense]|uniref:nitroreductase/quinone reductase family protein n=1 Tax=Mycobacterium malmoense TaxID=1780 RepID=UPI00111C1B4C|nr:nitroreductase/quinone reductase family protein [Mycobacterium malmoense]QZA17758.1 nitroreductase/quinone reductase family protein [Mycobacterium malmoense]UNB94538.1 nitroreductase family deazaflavin-dependent oxidoreductase [Mycobacterium malmoense]
MQSRTQRVGNVLARAALRAPLLHRLVSNRMLIITVAGRRTGRRYRIPVGYVGIDGRILIGTGGNWFRNLRPDTPVEVLVRRQTMRMLPQVIDDMDTAYDLYGDIIRHNPIHGRYAKIRLDSDGRPDRGDLAAALKRGVRVVQLQPCQVTTG